MVIKCRFCGKRFTEPGVEFFKGSIKCPRCKTMNIYNVVPQNNPAMDTRVLRSINVKTKAY